MIRRCMLCNSTKFELIFETDKCPKYSHKYLFLSELKGDKYIQLKIVKCKECDLVQSLVNFDPDEYKRDYQRTISFSPTAKKHAETYADKLMEYQPDTILEIGCGDGMFSEMLHNRGAHIIALEPSKAAYKLARKRGITVRNVYFNAQTASSIPKLDGFVMRFVLEHLHNPCYILEKLNKKCKDGAIGLIEVPNGLKQLENNKWYEFFSEHLIYFTPTTLTVMLKKAGFDVRSIELTQREEFITAIVCKPKISISDTLLKRQMVSFFSTLKGKKVYVYGASGAGITLLSECGITGKQVQVILDSDKNKEGLIASGSQIRIQDPKIIPLNDPDAILITSVVYEREIYESLRKNGYTGRIGRLLPRPGWL